MMSKKGLSALVITVLLVAISIGLGTMVVSWVTTYSTQSVAETRHTSGRMIKCQDIKYTVYKVEISEVNGSYNNLSLFIENGDKPISGFLLRVEDEDGNILFLPRDLGDVNSYFKPNQRKWIHFFCDTCNGSILSAELIPLVRDPQDPTDLIPCEMNHRTYDSSSFEYR